MWLEVSPTNHDPKVVARFYLEALEKIGGMFGHFNMILGVPKFLRSDYGTENCALHIAFHLKNYSSLRERCYIYGPSTSNTVSTMNKIIIHWVKVGGPSCVGTKHLGGSTFSK